MTAQLLYDLRALTGFISGQDLSRLFDAMGVGPSPSGREKVDLAQARRLCPALDTYLGPRGDLKKIGAHAEEYTGVKGLASRFTRLSARANTLSGAIRAEGAPRIMAALAKILADVSRQ